MESAKVRNKGLVLTLLYVFSYVLRAELFDLATSMMVNLKNGVKIIYFWLSKLQ